MKLFQRKGHPTRLKAVFIEFKDKVLIPRTPTPVETPTPTSTEITKIVDLTFRGRGGRGGRGGYNYGNNNNSNGNNNDKPNNDNLRLSDQRLRDRYRI
jgi:hypothetical protein